MEESFDEIGEEFCRMWRKYIESSEYANVKFEEWPLIHKVFYHICKDKNFANTMFRKMYQKLTIEKLNDDDWNALTNFLLSAKRDLNIAKLAYDKKYYDIAIYHLQQSIEKLTKYWLMIYCGFRYSEIISISHKTPWGYLQWLSNYLKVVVDTLEKNVRKTYTPEIDENLLNLLKDARKYTEKLKKKIEEHKNEIFNASAEEIMKGINSIDAIYNEFLKRYNRLIKDYEEHKEVEPIIYLSQLSQEIGKENIPLFIEYMGSYYEMQIKTLYLYILGAYSYVHEGPSRYYNSQLKKGPSDYNTELGIVSVAPEIFKRVKDVISTYEKFEKKREHIWKILEKLELSQEAPEDGGV